MRRSEQLKSASGWRAGVTGAIFALVITASGQSHADTAMRDIELSDVRTRATPKDASTAASYMTITNHGLQGDRLVAIFTPIAETVRIEKTVWRGLTMRMDAVREVDIPAGGQVIFRPGHYQLTLVNITHQLRPNTTVPMELRFEKAGRIEVTSKVVNKLLGN